MIPGWADRLGIAAAAVALGLLPLFGSAVDFAAAPALALAVPHSAAVLVIVLELGSYVVCAWYVMRSRTPLPPLFWPITLIATIGTLAGMLGFDPYPGMGAGLMLFGLAFLYAATTRAYAVPGGRNVLLTTLLGSSGAASLIALGMVAVRRPAAVFADNHGRAVGTFLNSNELAFYLVVTFASALGILIATRRPAMRVLAAGVAAIGLVTLVLTFSRSGLLSVAIAVMFLFVSLRPNRWVVPAALVVLIGVSALSFNDVNHHNPAESLSRVTAWEAGLRTVARFPLFGVGPLSYHRTYPVVRPPDGPSLDEPIAFDAHNMLLSVASEGGLAGLVAVFYLLWRFGVLMRAQLASASPAGRVMGLAVCAGLVGTGADLMLNTVSIAAPVWSQFFALALAATQFGADDA